MGFIGKLLGKDKKSSTYALIAAIGLTISEANSPVIRILNPPEQVRQIGQVLATIGLFGLGRVAADAKSEPAK